MFCLTVFCVVTMCRCSSHVGYFSPGQAKITQIRTYAVEAFRVTKMHLCLRQHGTFRSNVCCLDALRASKQHTRKRSTALPKAQSTNCVILPNIKDKVPLRRAKRG